ncbi:T9SS type B sorting domain-containing protein [Flavobacterium sp. DGU11]|uniref:T9SS type B sorting domain-containing protein n=1 Tax=Flavobacterium arundinis TaxID=3139143 RepID=A0ABU9HS97_9FLAO
MIHKYRIAIVLLLCAHSAVYGQLETSHWYFGKNAGLDFTSGVLVIDNSSQMDANEGTASFSDEFGNLLFYTDGSTVYTRNHAIMPNGTGLHGHRSSTQSSIIVPAPNTAGLYYIFTTDAIERFLELPLGSQSKGLNYSIVDMSLGVDGEVTVKNIPLPLSGLQRCNEQLTAVARADCSGYWVITSYFGKFYSFSVTSGGVDANPVVSAGGPNSILPGAGYLRASHDGKKIAYTSFTENGGLRVYDFNNNDGTVSNENILYALPRQYYGVEFSPDNTVLYASTANNLLQYDLTSMPVNSEVTLATNNGNMQGALQLGPDNKIYYADKKQYAIDEYLSVINDPDNFGSPGYVHDAVSLGRRRGFGLPNFIPYMYHVKLFINDIDTITEACEGSSLAFSYCHVNRATTTSTVLWDFGDGNTSTDEAPEHTYAAAGTYTVTLSVTIGGKAYISATEITIIAAPEAENAEQDICVPQGATHTFNLTESYSQINPNNEDVTITFHATEQKAKDKEDALPSGYTTPVSKSLWIRIENEHGCYTIRQMQLVVNETPVLNTQAVVTLCSGNTVVLQVTAQPSDTINWYATQNGTTPIFTGNNYETPVLTANASYWVEAVSPAGCLSGRTKVTVTVNSLSVSTQNAVTCSGTTAILIASSPGNTINWYNSAAAVLPVATGTQFTTPILTSNTSYWVEAVAPSGCLSARTQVSVTVNALPIVTVADVNVTACEGSVVMFSASSTGNIINWYSSETAAQPVATGTAFTTPQLIQSASWWVEARSPQGCFSGRAEVSVIVEPTPDVTVEDTNITICTGETTVLTASSPGNTINWYSDATAALPVATGIVFTTPALSATTSYWVEAVSPQGCISGLLEIEVIVIQGAASLFDLQQVYCLGSQPIRLPAISDNGIHGTWSPAVINTSNAGILTYIFTPDIGQCTVEQVVLQVEVTENITPEFNLEAVYFFKGASQELPTVSNNGVSGTWYDPYIDMAVSGKRSYTFIPDPDQCAKIFTTEIRVIDYPRYFSPNGDGLHDLWNIWGFTREYKAQINIFDRYGKLIKQFDPLREGWDGTYNGNTLPATDYWFTVTFMVDGNNREFRAHFSLLR